MTPSRQTFAWAGMGILVALAVPSSRAMLEASMATHMLVQIPLAAAAGALLAPSLPLRLRELLGRWNDYGIPGTVLALGISAYWMIPRALDAALASAAVEAMKFVSLPLLVGLPLALSWRRLWTLRTMRSSARI